MTVDHILIRCPDLAAHSEEYWLSSGTCIQDQLFGGSTMTDDGIHHRNRTVHLMRMKKRKKYFKPIVMFAVEAKYYGMYSTFSSGVLSLNVFRF